MTPQDELRTAARNLRTVGFACGGETWEVGHHPEGTIVHVGGHSIFRLHAVGGRRPSGTPCVFPQVGNWIALAGPALTRPLASWLEDVAEGFEAEQRTEPMDSSDEYAVTIARLINGSAEAGAVSSETTETTL